MKHHLALALTLTIAPLANAALININFTGFTGGNQGPTEEADISGPAGGLGTTWNQYNNEDTSGTVLDSSGAATSIQVTTNFSEGRYDGGGPTLPIYRATLTDFGRGVNSRNVTISGLDAGGLYDIWLMSLRSQGADAERLVGWWSTGSTTTSSSDQFYDNRISPTINNSTFVAGENYVLFENVEADGSGQIIFNGVAGTELDGSDDTYRQGLNGLQINLVPEPGSLALLGLGGLLVLRRRR